MSARCGKRYIVVKTGIPATCQMDAGHDDPELMGGHPRRHARRVIIGDIEPGWGQFGAPFVWPDTESSERAK